MAQKDLQAVEFARILTMMVDKKELVHTYTWRTPFPILESFFSSSFAFVLMGGGCFLRDMDYCKCPYYHCCDRVWSTLSGMGHSTARLGGWAACSRGVLVHHFFHVHSPCRFLQVSWPCHRQQKLYLHGCCESPLRWVKYILAMNLLPNMVKTIRFNNQ